MPQVQFYNSNFICLVSGAVASIAFNKVSHTVPCTNVIRGIGRDLLVLCAHTTERVHCGRECGTCAVSPATGGQREQLPGCDKAPVVREGGSNWRKSWE